MKVLHVITGNDSGGGSKYVINICRASSELFENAICCIGDGPLDALSKNENIMTFKLSMKEAISIKFKSLIEEEKISIINFHGAKAFFLYSLIGSGINIPCVATVHSNFKTDFKNSKFKNIFFTLLSGHGLRKFHNYICVSEYIQSIIDNEGCKGNKYIVRNGIDLSKNSIFNSRREIRNTYGILEDDFLFVCVARLHPVKNHIRLIKAFEKISKQYNDVKLLLLGDGELENNLNSLINELKINNKVVMAGFKKNSYDFVNASDVSVLVSTNEGGAPPLSILEYAAAKRCIVCSKIGDIGDIFNDNELYFVDPNSIEDIYNGLKKAYLNKEKNFILENNIYEKVIKDFNMNKFHENYYKALKDIIDRGK